jgi:hypothetical protein
MKYPWHICVRAFITTVCVIIRYGFVGARMRLDKKLQKQIEELTGNKYQWFEWARPKHGDVVGISTWNGIENVLIKWDQERYGFGIGACFRTQEGDLEYKELVFLSEEDLDDERFRGKPAE